jgi:hypothetical protein
LITDHNFVATDGLGPALPDGGRFGSGQDIVGVEHALLVVGATPLGTGDISRLRELELVELDPLLLFEPTAAAPPAAAAAALPAAPPLLGTISNLPSG